MPISIQFSILLPFLDIRLHPLYNEVPKPPLSQISGFSLPRTRYLFCLRSDTPSRSHPDCRLAATYSLFVLRGPEDHVPWPHYSQSRTGQRRPTFTHFLFQLPASVTRMQQFAFDPLMRSILILDSFDKRRREYRSVGWLYAARNACFVDPVFKVGQTKRSPAVRVDELSGSTSVYKRFELVYWVHVGDRDVAEGYAHTVLQQHRVNPSKEFFDAPVTEVVRALDEAAAHCLIPLGRTPRAGYLEPGLEPRVIRCSRCAASNRLPQILVPVRTSCGSCNHSFILHPPGDARRSMSK